MRYRLQIPVKMYTNAQASLFETIVLELPRGTCYSYACQASAKRTHVHAQSHKSDTSVSERGSLTSPPNLLLDLLSTSFNDSSSSSLSTFLEVLPARELHVVFSCTGSVKNLFLSWGSDPDDERMNVHREKNKECR